MSIAKTIEEVMLGDVEGLLAVTERSLGPVARLPVLEAIASRVGGWSLSSFRGRFGAPEIADAVLAPVVDAVTQRLTELPLPTPLAIAALGRPAHSRGQQRVQGAFYTDFRLARFVGEQIAAGLGANGHWVDLASGSGALLVACVLGAARGDRLLANELVARAVCAADLDGGALRACRASLAALCVDVEAIVQVDMRLRRQDSLLVGRSGWSDLAPSGFDVVVGNPPWEKVKLSTHEFLLSNGQDRHYGAEYQPDGLDVFALTTERAQRAAYAATVERRFPVAANGELDLYKAFVACSLEHLGDRGRCCLIVPAGLIRSQGSESLRRQLLQECGELAITVVDNRARLFAIDSRFKFLVVNAAKGVDRKPIRLGHAFGSPHAVRTARQAKIERSILTRIRPDLTIPEVRDAREWRLAVAMHERGAFLDVPGSPFHSTIVREVDMSRDRSRFSTDQQKDHLPLAEGRMVAQHRFGAKAYRSGTGRRALWDARPNGESIIQPQFYFPLDAVPGTVLRRTKIARVGYCDITGQTNERSIIAARVPDGVVCGNKVPTITFEGDADQHLTWLFLAIANSFAFDWIARRLLTTSVNYFVLRSLPLPPIKARSPVAARLALLASRLAASDSRGRAYVASETWAMAEIRAEIDAHVAAAWGLGVDDLNLMFEDFPLLDRRQPALPGEPASTVTADLAKARLGRLSSATSGPWTKRVELARKIGAFPYTPSEYVDAEEKGGQAASGTDFLAGDSARGSSQARSRVK